MNRRVQMVVLSVVVAMLVAMIGGGSAWGVTVTDGDVVAGHYVYDLDYADMEETSGVFEGDVSTSSNVETENDLWGDSHYLRCLSGYASAGFEYVFDFSGCSQQPISVDIRDKVSLFNTEGDEDCEMVTEWSTDGMTYTELTSATSPGGGGSNTQQSDSTIVLPSGTETFYYRMTATVLPGDADGGFYGSDNQWNRVGSSASTDYFRMDVMMSSYSGGEGTEADPHVIATPDDVCAIGLLPKT